MNIALCGLGKAGAQVVRSIDRGKNHKITALFCRNGSSKAGKSIRDAIPVSQSDCRFSELKEAARVFEINPCDVLIDFSGKKATLALLPVCARYGVRMVVCTTGFTQGELALMEKTARETPGFALIYAPNVSLGINVMMFLAREAAKFLPDFDFALTEKHHRRKQDVSATAKRMAKGLEGILGKPVSLNSIRAGGYVGLHELLIANEFERITIIHESFSRQTFANGALKAAEFLQQRCGWFHMEDVAQEHLDARS